MLENNFANLKISSQLIANQATSRGWKVRVISAESSLLEVTLPDGRRTLLRSVIGPLSRSLDSIIADDKTLTALLAQEYGLQTPPTATYASLEEAQSFLDTHGVVVVKPKDAAHGNGITVNIRDAGALEAAIQTALAVSDNVIVQKMVNGTDFRILFIGNQHVATAIREAASVNGDGKSTIRELIEWENSRPERQADYQAALNKIPVDAAARFLGSKLDDVPAVGEKVTVVGTSNIGTGGESIDRTDSTPEPVLSAARDFHEKLGAPLMAYDFILEGETPYLIEMNSSPSFGLHELPHHGQSRPVTQAFLDWLERSL